VVCERQHPAQRGFGDRAIDRSDSRDQRHVGSRTGFDVDRIVANAKRPIASRFSLLETLWVVTRGPSTITPCASPICAGSNLAQVLAKGVVLNARLGFQNVQTELAIQGRAIRR